MTGAEITAWIAILLGGGLVGAVLTWTQGRHRPAIERKQADEATIKLQSEIRTADVDGLRDIIELLRTEVAQVPPLRAEVAQLRERDTAREREWWIDRRYIRDLHETHPGWPNWRPGWVAALYAPDGAPNFPPTPGSVIEPPRPRKEQ